MDDAGARVVPVVCGRAPGAGPLPYPLPMPTAPEQQRSINGLLAQAHTGNVLQVAASCASRPTTSNVRSTARNSRSGSSRAARIPSRSTRPRRSRAQHAELRAAVEALRLSAISYGFTDQDLEGSFRNLVER